MQDLPTTIAKADALLDLHLRKGDDGKSKKDGKSKDKTLKSGKTASKFDKGKKQSKGEKAKEKNSSSYTKWKD